MATPRKVEVELVVNSEGVVTAIKTADGELIKLKQTTDEVDDRTRRLSTSMKVGLAGALVAVGAAARGAFQILHESVQLAGVQQIAENKLEQALRNTGDTSAESAEMLKRLAAELQGVSNFGDEATITAQAMLLSFQEVAGAQGAALLTPRLADLAAGLSSVTGKTIDLNQAANTLGGALIRGSGALREYGISITEVQESALDSATGLDRVRVLAEIIDSSFMGMARATRDSFVVMQNAVGDLKETLGSDLRPELEQTADAFTSFLQDKRTVDAAKSIGSGILTAGRAIVEFFQVQVPYAIARFRLISAQANAEIARGAGFVANAITRPVQTLAALAAGTTLPNPFQNYIDGYESLAANAHDSLVAIALEEQARQRAARTTEEETQGINAQTDAIVRNTAARTESAAAIERPAVEVQQRPPDEFVQDLPELGNPLEVFDVNSIAAVNEAIAGLNDELLRVGNQEARDGIMQEIIALEKLRDTMEGVTETTSAAESQFAQMVASAQIDFENLGNSVIDFTLAFIQAKLVEALAGAVAKEFATKGLVGAFTAAAVVGAVNGAFSLIRSKIPKFATGVTNFGGGLAIVGDDPRRGGSGELVSLPRGSDVRTASETRNILNNLSRLQDRAPVQSDAAINRQTEVLTGALQGLGDRIADMRVELDLINLRDAQNRQGRQMRAIGNRAG